MNVKVVKYQVELLCVELLCVELVVEGRIVIELSIRLVRLQAGFQQSKLDLAQRGIAI